MWVFLSGAYLSVVEDRNDRTRLMVRARLRGDIERVFPLALVSETPAPADYRFRSSIMRAAVEREILRAVQAINYTNFKNSVPDRKRHDTYLRVWSVMMDAQENAIDEEQGGPFQFKRTVTAKGGRYGMLHAGGRVSARDLPPVGSETSECIVPHASEFPEGGTARERLSHLVDLVPAEVPRVFEEPSNPRGKKAPPPRSSHHRK